MTVSFSFDHQFRNASAATLLEAYFDLEHLAAQDRSSGLGDRVLVSSHDDGAVLARTWRVWAVKPLPLIIRPLFRGRRLSYVEAMRWPRPERRAELRIESMLPGGRVAIDSEYQLTELGGGRVCQRFTGAVMVDSKVMAPWIERATLDELARALPEMNRCTQDWIDRTQR